MKCLRFLIPVAILFFSLRVEPSEKISKQSLTSQGNKHKYYLFVPDTVETPAPLLITLHGYGRNGLSLVEKWKDFASKEGIILAGPDSWNSPTWRIPQDGPQFLFDLAEELKTKYSIDPRRIYLFGHSMGAIFALTISMLESQYFAATAIHAGAWQNSQLSLTDIAKRKIPIAIFVGDRDELVSIAEVNTTSERLKQKGFHVELMIRAGHNHQYYDLAEYINEQLWNFLKRYGLSEQPVYNRYSFDE